MLSFCISLCKYTLFNYALLKKVKGTQQFILKRQISNLHSCVIPKLNKFIFYFISLPMYDRFTIIKLPSWNVPSGMKKAPTVIPTNIKNLKNQNLLTTHNLVNSCQYNSSQQCNTQAQLLVRPTRSEWLREGLCCSVRESW